MNTLSPVAAGPSSPMSSFLVIFGFIVGLMIASFFFCTVMSHNGSGISSMMTYIRKYAHQPSLDRRQSFSDVWGAFAGFDKHDQRLVDHYERLAHSMEDIML
jgi:hypothetical protein